MNRLLLVVCILTVLVTLSGRKERRDAAIKQRHAIYDEVYWFMG